MSQQALELNLCTRRTRKTELLELMEGVVPGREFVSQLTAVAPPQATGRPPCAHETMLRLHLLYRTFAGLGSTDRLPDRVSILGFGKTPSPRHLMQGHDLAKQFFETVNGMLRAKDLMLQRGTVVDATIISAPNSTKNSTGQRDLQMHQTNKGNQWHHGMKAHIGADGDSGLVRAVVGTAANGNAVTLAHALVHGNEADVYADAGYQGVAKREEVQGIEVNWHIAMRPGKRRALDKRSPMGATLDKIEQPKASIRAKVEHPFQVIKRQFSHTKVRYRSLAKNTAQLFTLFMLSNRWMVRKRFMQTTV